MTISRPSIYISVFSDLMLFGIYCTVQSCIFNDPVRSQYDPDEMMYLPITHAAV